MRARGWAETLITGLQVIAPAAPVVAQFLLAGGTVAGRTGQGEIIRALADALEEPGGVAMLQRYLEAD
jgi:hypothetical protein